MIQQLKITIKIGHTELKLLDHQDQEKQTVSEKKEGLVKILNNI